MAFGRRDHAEIVAAALGKDFCYCPNFVGKGDCRNPECRGEAAICKKSSDPPTNASCWRSSYKWHLRRKRNNQQATMLRILVDGQMGPGQKIEDQMAKELGIPVREIRVRQSSTEEEVLEALRGLGWKVQSEMDLCIWGLKYEATKVRKYLTSWCKSF